MSMRLIDAESLKELFPDNGEGSWTYNATAKAYIDAQPTIQPERKTGHWILDRSGAYCCSKCMEPCAGYVMMKPRDRFCKMCGAKMDGGE